MEIYKKTKSILQQNRHYDKSLHPFLMNINVCLDFFGNESGSRRSPILQMI